MPDYEQRLLAFAQRIDGRWWMSQIALSHEHSVLSADAEKGRELLARRLKDTFESLPVAELYQRRWGWEYEVRQSEIVVTPPRDAAWQPVTLRFDWIAWTPAPDVHIAYVPALDLEVLQARAERLPAAVEQEIRAALERSGGKNPLEHFVRIERRCGLEVSELQITVELRTPKEMAQRALDQEGPQESVLKRIASDLTRQKLPEAFEAEVAVAQLAELLSGAVPRSVLLIGPSGVGKTAAFYQLVRERARRELGRTPFWATGGARLVAGMSGFGMWQEQCRALCREAAKKKAVVYLGNLVELAEAGRCASQSESIATFLRPHLLRGDLVAVAECTPEQHALLERDLPQVLQAFTMLKVEQPDRERGRRILEQQAAAGAREGGRPDAPAIDTLDRLHRRYAGYSAYPGRPLRLLKNLSRDTPRGSAVSAADVTRAFARETGLPLVLLDEQTPLDLAATERWFGERVRGQPEAIELVVGLLATVKAGLTRPGRPVASLLFIGPTGVGKTETAKALAEFLYQRADRMVRFDMTEYADYAAVERLAGGAFGAQGLLTSRVREQPFTVVLFDEFEKAHPRFFDLLLQVLGEARLTDAGGRVADFSNAVVIMTSNLGADSFQRGMSGFAPTPAGSDQAREHFVRHVRQFLRPELFNRIDRIVPFAPLDRATIAAIAQRELAEIYRRDGIVYGGVSLDLSPEVTDRLVERGYEPRYGARPLKRAIERQLLAPLAAGLNAYSGDLARTGEARLDDGELKVVVRARPNRAGRTDLSTDGDAIGAAERATSLRRSLQGLERSADALRLRNEAARLTMSEERWLREQRKGRFTAPPEELGRLSRLRRLLDELDAVTARVVALEDETLMDIYTANRSGRDRHDELRTLTEQWRELLFDVYAQRYLDADRVLVTVYGEDQRQVRALSHAYFALARGRGLRCDLHLLKTHDAQRDFNKPGVRQLRTQVEQPDGTAKETVIDALRADLALFDWHDEEPGAIGVALVLHGRLAYPLFEPERGLHVFRYVSRTLKCLVDIGDGTLDKYAPPAGIGRRGAVGPQPLRRTYNMASETADDERLGKGLQGTGRGIENLIAFAMEEWLRKDAESLLET
ncbi:MAG TPA: AAA family ATPase [Pirellulales bacterium]|nr:AAA family ATPase [Pirellulales bacterium]